MATAGLSTFTKSLKYVDKTYSLLRAGSSSGSCLSNQFGPRQALLTSRDSARGLSQSLPSYQGLLHSRLDPTLLKRFTDLQTKTDVLKSRDFMKLSGVTSSPNLTPTVDSGATFYFDTHKLVTTLQSHGFSLDQAETITDCLTEILTNGATGMSKYMVSTFHQVSHISNIYILDEFL